MIYIMAISLFLGAARLQTGSTLLCILLHSAMNLYSMLYFWLGDGK